MIKLYLKQNKLVLFHLLGTITAFVWKNISFNNGGKQRVYVFMDPIRDGKNVSSVLTLTFICGFVTSWKAFMLDIMLGTGRQ